MVGKEQVEEFYDNYIAHQRKVGINTRHRIIAKKVKKLGIAPTANILEIGCGIGTLSKLLIRLVPNGHFTGCDISPKSIEYARQFNPDKNAEFICSDMSDFTHSKKFDCVVFPDVLEHIPLEQHKNLFEIIAGISTENAIWFINIPEPNVLDYHREHNPHLLQIIDQSLSMQDLLNNVYPTGFELVSMNPYFIHTQIPNYVAIVFTNNPKVKSLNMRNQFKLVWQNFKAKYL